MAVRAAGSSQQEMACSVNRRAGNTKLTGLVGGVGRIALARPNASGTAALVRTSALHVFEDGDFTQRLHSGCASTSRLYPTLTS